MYSEKPFEFSIRLHGACGLLSDKGIYIVGGRYQEWSEEAFFYDIQRAGLDASPLNRIKKMPKALFGPAMTKPT